MIALQHTDVDDLNHRARARMQAADQLHGPTIQVDGVELRAGDRILCLRNDRRMGVVNGTFATIDALDGRDLLVVDDHGTRLRLPHRYLEAGHVTHGYAITGHKAQGLTVDHAFVLGSDAIHREWGYVALSRGRNSNRLYVHAAATDPHGITHGREPVPDPQQQTVAGLRRSAAKTPAVEHLVVDPDDELRLQAHRRVLARKLHFHDRRRAELLEREDALVGQIERIETHQARLQARRDQLPRVRLRKSARDQAAELQRQLAHDRCSLDAADRELASVRRQLDQLPSDDQVRRWRRQLVAVEQRLEQAAETRSRRAVRQPPRYVLTAIGGAPDDPDGRARWIEAIRTVESYRVRFGIHDPVNPLGHPGGDPGQREQRRGAVDALIAALPDGRQLHRHPAPQRDRSRHLRRRLAR